MSQPHASKALGRIVARVLQTSWRSEPEVPSLAENELNQIAPALLKCGAGALAWRVISGSALAETSSGAKLQQAYRVHSLQAAMHAAEIDYAIGALNRAGVEPVLVKGWSIARLYPEAGLRPYGDLDLCFAPEEYRVALSVLSELDPTRFVVDLHEGFGKLDSLPDRELLERTERVRVGGAVLRVLGEEDHLRILCTHSLRHGLWRPLWLSDISVAIERRKADFDWTRCLGEDDRQADWVRCAIALAGELLGADVSGTPASERVGSLPAWLVARVLKNWSRPYPELYPPQVYSRPMASYISRPSGLFQTLSVRWTDPIEASVRMRAPFNWVPRFPYQLGYMTLRVTRFLRR
ncbi:MAG TPA: nucleotidyltransferase family protein [Blastocatellia bacterium]|nr:nucleotidyltransferase family protein [Blastocatellia bacterium]